MKNKQKIFRAYTTISQLGINILVPILMCTVLGRWLENRFDWPVFVPLMLLGVASGIRNGWVFMARVVKDIDDKKKRY